MYKPRMGRSAAKMPSLRRDMLITIGNSQQQWLPAQDQAGQNYDAGRGGTKLSAGRMILFQCAATGGFLMLRWMALSSHAHIGSMNWT